jgi:hypothetical protein
MLKDVGNYVEVPVVFDLGYEDISATLRRRVSGWRLWVAEELDGGFA